MDNHDAIEIETAKLSKGSIDVDDLVRFIERISVVAEPEKNRCTAKRPNDTQCTRRCKIGIQFCGSHSKNAFIEPADGIVVHEVTAVDIGGIVHYVDDHNVYKTEDVLRNVVNPAIVATYTKIDGKYHVEW